VDATYALLLWKATSVCVRLSMVNADSDPT